MGRGTIADTLLIIDDDVRLSDMLRQYLSGAGFKVDARLTGRAGIDAVTRNAMAAARPAAWRTA